MREETTAKLADIVSEVDRGSLVSVRIAGTGELTLVWVHGFAGCKEEWAAQEDYFAQRYRCVMPDMPGHGSSDVPISTTVEHVAGILADIVSRHETGKVVLIGHSMGSRIVLETYNQSPDAVVGIILVDPSRMIATAHQPMASTDFASASQKLRKIFIEMFVPSSDPSLIGEVLNRVEAIDTSFAAATFSNFIEWDITKAPVALERIGVPLMSIQSTYLNSSFRRQSIVGVGDSPYAEFVLRHAPHATFEIIPRAGHFPHLENPEATNQLIDGFIQCLPRDRAY